MAYKASSWAGNSVPVGSSLVQALGTSVSIGDTIVVFKCGDSSVTWNIPTDTLSTTYSLQKTVLDSGNFEEGKCWVGVATSAGTPTITAGTSSAPGDGTINVLAFTGRDTSSPTESTASNVALSSAALDGVVCGALSPNPTASSDLAMFMTCTSSIVAGTIFSAGTNYTTRGTAGSGGGSQLGSSTETRDNFAGGATTPTATSGVSVTVLSMAISLKIAGAAPPAGPPQVAQQIYVMP